MGTPKTDVEAYLETVCAVDETGHLDVEGSISPAISSPGPILELLSELAPRGQAGIEGGLDYRDTLGEGGMGLVRLAIQRSLDRPVAVKTVRPDRKTDAALAALLREAWITGSLEHPNIMPIYDLGVGGEGQPLVVLKRIEGLAWEDLMDDPAEVERRFGASDLLAWNLSILMQVINAVRFAHSRGIVHRDLKPSNVMVGEFGEVYLLDWGIAVSTRDHSNHKFPSATDTSQPAGTPGYMAPEMLGGRPITEKTDVYLLGAVLYELVVGEVPHAADSIDGVIQSIESTPPKLPAGVPPELAAICTRAMAHDPADRFADVDELRNALREYSTHRESMLLTESAEQRLFALESHIERGGSGDEIHGVFTECRFGFREALKRWSGNPRATQGVRRAVELMVGYELEQDQPRSAQLLLGDLDEVPVELSERIDRALASKQEQDRRLARLAREHDEAAGWKTRNFLIGVVGFLWVVLPLMSNMLQSASPLVNYQRFAVVIGALGITVAGLVVWARDSLMKSVLNRRLTFIAVSTQPCMLLLLLGAYLIDLTVVQATQMSMFLWFVFATITTVTTSPRLIPMTIGYLAGFFVTIVSPQHALYVLSACNLTMLINVGLFSLARKHPPDSPVA